MPLELLLLGVWRLRWRVIAAALALLALGATLVMAWPRQYVAEAVVAPAETTGLAASTLIQGGLVMTGGLLDTRAGGNFAIYLASLRSAEAVRMLARDTAILEDLTIRKREGITGRLRVLLGVPPAPADLDDLDRWLDRNLAVTQSLATVTTSLSLPHPDRDTALDLLARLHAFGEQRVRDSLDELARRRVAALEARLAAERDIFMRNPMYELLAQHQRAGVIARADDAVAARLVSAPSVGISPALPNRPLLLMLLGVTVPLACLLLAACRVLLFGVPAERVRRGRGARVAQPDFARKREE
jgi:LPS O-antigen subunit length determinant protein (WzzB/FepE family)